MGRDERFTSEIVQYSGKDETFAPAVWRLEPICHDRLEEIAVAPTPWREALQSLVTVLLTLAATSVIWEALWTAPCYVLAIGLTIGWYATAAA
jgi:hypothetical protein